ncbi:hypothetical protein [Nostoc piscinale]
MAGIRNGKKLMELTGVGWVEERNPTFTHTLLGYAIATPNLLFF